MANDLFYYLFVVLKLMFRLLDGISNIIEFFFLLDYTFHNAMEIFLSFLQIIDDLWSGEWGSFHCVFHNYFYIEKRTLKRISRAGFFNRIIFLSHWKPIKIQSTQKHLRAQPNQRIKPKVIFPFSINKFFTPFITISLKFRENLNILFANSCWKVLSWIDFTQVSLIALYMQKFQFM